jgi:hypothetical protein
MGRTKDGREKLSSGVVLYTAAGPFRLGSFLIYLSSAIRQTPVSR